MDPTERVNPGTATASRGRVIVVVSFAEPIRASGRRAASSMKQLAPGEGVPDRGTLSSPDAAWTEAQRRAAVIGPLAAQDAVSATPVPGPALQRRRTGF